MAAGGGPWRQVAASGGKTTIGSLPCMAYLPAAPSTLGAPPAQQHFAKLGGRSCRGSCFASRSAALSTITIVYLVQQNDPVCAALPPPHRPPSAHRQRRSHSNNGQASQARNLCAVAMEECTGNASVAACRAAHAALRSHIGTQMAERMRYCIHR